MPFYPEELVEEVRSSNDIVDIIGSYVRLQKKGSTYFGLCPFHNEKTPSFSVSPGKQMYYCFGCGAGGNVITFLMEYENYSFPEALQVLADRAGIELPKKELSEEDKMAHNEREQILQINKEAANLFYLMLRSEKGQQGMAYFKNRELSENTMKKFALGYAGKNGGELYRYLRQKGYSDQLLSKSGLIKIDEQRGGYGLFFNRVMFPIQDSHGHVIGFGGRVMGEGEPKYLNSPETICFEKSRNMYGLNFARTSRKPGFLICEGYMDVIALHQAGFDNAVASLGTAFTAGHAGLLRRFTKEAYLTFDSDGAGIKAALRAIPILKEAGINSKIVHMEPYKDPDEFIKNLGAEAYQERIDQAENSFLFQIRILQREYDMNDPQGKTDFYHETARRLLSFQEEMERENYLDAVSEAFQINRENLKKLMIHLSNQISVEELKPKPLKTGRTEPKKEDGMKQSQKLLLTWLIEDSRIYGIIKNYIGPSDFTEDLYHQVADVLFGQLEQGQVNPAKIVSMFEQEEDQRQVAALFNATLKEVESKQEKEKALKETIVRVKANSIARHSQSMEATDMATLMQVVEDKRKLQTLEKLHISID